MVRKDQGYYRHTKILFYITFICLSILNFSGGFWALRRKDRVPVRQLTKESAWVSVWLACLRKREKSFSGSQAETACSDSLSASFTCTALCLRRPASAAPPLPSAFRYSCDVLISLDFLQVVKKLNSPLTTNLYFLPLYCRKLFFTKSNFTSFYLLNFIILLYLPRLSDSLPFLNLIFR